MAVRIRLLRMGKIRNPQYRIVVADSRTRRDGRAIEFLGIYHPKEEPSLIEVNSERVLYWLGVGAQPSEPVRAILSKTGDWQKFKGLPAPEPLKVAPARADRRAAYEAEAKAAGAAAEAKAAGAAAEAKAKRAPESKKASEAKAAEASKSAGESGKPAGESKAAQAADAASPAAQTTSEEQSGAGAGAAA